MNRLPFVLVTSLVCAVLTIGCKQDLGERCQQDSDCSSGHCNVGSMICGTGVSAPPPMIDASQATDTTPATEAGGETSPADAKSEAGDATAETSSDAASDLSEAGADSAAAETGTSDAPGEAASGG